jgi:hypothetical protein
LASWPTSTGSGSTTNTHPAPHQGTDNNVIFADFSSTSAGPIKLQERLDGIVAQYEQEAA